MALRIKSRDGEKLVDELASMPVESKTEVVSLSQQRPLQRRGSDFLRYLEEEVWPKAPVGQLCRCLSREEEDELLGYGARRGLIG